MLYSVYIYDKFEQWILGLAALHVAFIERAIYRLTDVQADAIIKLVIVRNDSEVVLLLSLVCIYMSPLGSLSDISSHLILLYVIILINIHFVGIPCNW